MKHATLQLTRADFAEAHERAEAERLVAVHAQEVATATKGKVHGSAHPAFLAWKAGTSIRDLVGQHPGCGTRSQVRRILTQAAGGKPAFAALRQAGAGGSLAPFGGKTHTPRAPGEPAVPAMDDSKVPHVSAKARKRWTHRSTFLPDRYHTECVIYQAPDGTEYVRAKATERADVIFDWPKDGWRYEAAFGIGIRMRRYATSNVVKHAKREAKLIQQGEAARARKTSTRRARRAKGKK